MQNSQARLMMRLITCTLVLLVLMGLSGCVDEGSTSTVMPTETQVGLPTKPQGMLPTETQNVLPSAQSPVGNTYPAGPAPTSAPPSDGSIQIALQVPSSLQSGVFATDHTLTMPPGFSISVYAQLEGSVRMLASAPIMSFLPPSSAAGRLFG
jgi:hypothetical protein